MPATLPPADWYRFWPTATPFTGPGTTMLLPWCPAEVCVTHVFLFSSAFYFDVENSLLIVFWDTGAVGQASKFYFFYCSDHRWMSYCLPFTQPACLIYVDGLLPIRGWPASTPPAYLKCHCCHLLHYHHHCTCLHHFCCLSPVPAELLHFSFMWSFSFFLFLLLNILLFPNTAVLWDFSLDKY